MSETINISELVELSYDPRWLEWGLLDRELFRQQLERFRAGDGYGTEHDRYAMFQSALARTGALKPEEIANLIEPATVDSDTERQKAYLTES